MSAFSVAAYVVANLVVAVMLGCMLQSKFVESELRFRLVLGLLSAAAVGCMFYGLQELEALVAGEPGGRIGGAQLVQALLFALFLVMIRARQVSRGEHEHPRVRATTTIRLEGDTFTAGQVREFLGSIEREPRR
jgi:hypothetical protein